MSFEYLDRPLREYLDRLSEKLPCPGGGSVAALAGALSSALVGMVANFTVGKKKYAIHEKEMQDILRQNENLRNQLQGLIEKDSEIYEQIQAASTDDPEGLQGLLKESASLHRGLCEKTLRILEWNCLLLENGNRNLLSDVGISAVLAWAAFRSARINVAINLKYLKDEAFGRETEQFLDALEAKVEETARELYATVVNRLQRR